MTPDLRALCEMMLRKRFLEEAVTGLRNDGFVSGEMHRCKGDGAVVGASSRISVMAARSCSGMPTRCTSYRFLQDVPSTDHGLDNLTLLVRIRALRAE